MTPVHRSARSSGRREARGGICATHANKVMQRCHECTQHGCILGQGCTLQRLEPRGQCVHMTDRWIGASHKTGSQEWEIQGYSSMITDSNRRTDQLSVSGEMVLSLLRCFHQVLHEAFSSLIPFAISYLKRVMDRQERQTSSSFHWWLR
jgi:hypothetical protein